MKSFQTAGWLPPTLRQSPRLTLRDFVTLGWRTVGFSGNQAHFNDCHFPSDSSSTLDSSREPVLLFKNMSGIPVLHFSLFVLCPEFKTISLLERVCGFLKVSILLVRRWCHGYFSCPGGEKLPSYHFTVMHIPEGPEMLTVLLIPREECWTGCLVIGHIGLSGSTMLHTAY